MLASTLGFLKIFTFSTYTSHITNSRCWVECTMPLHFCPEVLTLVSKTSSQKRANCLLCRHIPESHQERWQVAFLLWTEKKCPKVLHYLCWLRKCINLSQLPLTSFFLSFTWTFLGVMALPSLPQDLCMNLFRRRPEEERAQAVYIPATNSLSWGTEEHSAKAPEAQCWNTNPESTAYLHVTLGSQLNVPMSWFSHLENEWVMKPNSSCGCENERRLTHAVRSLHGKHSVFLAGREKHSFFCMILQK